MNKCIIEDVSTMKNVLTKVNDWFSKTGLWHVQWLIFERVNDWHLSLFIFHFWNYSWHQYNMFKNEKLKNEWKWKIEKWITSSIIKNEKLKNELGDSWLSTPCPQAKPSSPIGLPKDIYFYLYIIYIYIYIYMFQGAGSPPPPPCGCGVGSGGDVSKWICFLSTLHLWWDYLLEMCI